MKQYLEIFSQNNKGKRLLFMYFIDKKEKDRKCILPNEMRSVVRTKIATQYGNKSWFFDFVLQIGVLDLELKIPQGSQSTPALARSSTLILILMFLFLTSNLKKLSKKKLFYS